MSVNRITDKFSVNDSAVNVESDDMETKWDIASSVLFCVTVISTIGEY